MIWPGRYILSSLLLALLSVFLRHLTILDEIYQEDYKFLLAGLHMLTGELPEREFSMFPFNFAFVLNFFGQWAFGASLFSYALVQYLFLALSVGLSSYFVARLTRSVWPGVLSAVLIVAVDPRLLYTYKTFALSLGFAALCVFMERPNRPRAVSLGLAAGVAALLRADLGLIVVLGAAMAILVSGRGRLRAQFLRHTLAAMAGFAVLAIPAAAYVSHHTGLPRYLASLVFAQDIPEKIRQEDRNWRADWLPLPTPPLWTRAELERPMSTLEIDLSPETSAIDRLGLAAEFSFEDRGTIRLDDGTIRWTVGATGLSEEDTARLKANGNVINVSGLDETTGRLPIHPYRDVPIDVALFGIDVSSNLSRIAAYYASWIGALALLVVGVFTLRRNGAVIPSCGDALTQRGAIPICIAMMAMISFAVLFKGSAVSGIRIQEAASSLSYTWPLLLHSMAGRRGVSVRAAPAIASATIIVFLFWTFGDIDGRLPRKTAALLEPTFLRVAQGNLRRLWNEPDRSLAQDATFSYMAVGLYLRACLRPKQRYFSFDYQAPRAGFIAGRLTTGGPISIFPAIPPYPLLTDEEIARNLDRSRPPIVFGKEVDSGGYALVPEHFPLTLDYVHKNYLRAESKRGSESHLVEGFYFWWRKDLSYSKLDARLGLPCESREPAAAPAPTN